MDDSKPPKELPQWQSHKKVWAAKIERIDVDATPSRSLLHLEGGFEISVDETWIGKHVPASATFGDLVGGYYVRYADGYESWSPGAAFDEGYTRID